MSEKCDNDWTLGTCKYDQKRHMLTGDCENWKPTPAPVPAEFAPTGRGKLGVCKDLMQPHYHEDDCAGWTPLTEPPPPIIQGRFERIDNLERKVAAMQLEIDQLRKQSVAAQPMTSVMVPCRYGGAQHRLLNGEKWSCNKAWCTARAWKVGAP